MKRYMVGLLFGILCLGAQAADEFHMFTDTQGRTIELKLIKFDSEHGRISVERKDGRRLTVNLDNFCEADHDYVQQWFIANELLSERNLKIGCDDKVVSKRKETVTGMQASSSGSQLKEVEIGEKKYEKIAYEITFENKTSEPIENARLEYRIYYEQTERGVDQDSEQKVFRGETVLALLAPGSSSEFMTEAVEIFNDNLSALNVITLDEKGNESSGALEEGEGEIHGIRGRLIVPLASGENLIREFHHPSSLSEKQYPWDPSEPSLGIQR
jgi:hypothetical protein